MTVKPIKEVSQLKPFYYVYSKEQVFVEEALYRLKASFQAVSPTAEILELRLETSQLGRIKDVMETVSFFGEKRLLILQGVDKAGKNLQHAITDLIKNSTGDNVLVLVGERELDDKDLASLIKEKGMVHAFSSPAYSDVPKRIAARIGELSEQVPPKVRIRLANILIQRVGRDITKTFHEAEKLGRYFVGLTSEEISAMSDEDLVMLLTPSEERSIFQFLDAVCDRDVNNAWNTMAIMVKHGESYHGILYSLVNHFRLLLKIKMSMEVADTAQELRQKVEGGKRMHDFRYKKLVKAAENFSLMDLRTAYEKMLMSEVSSKTGALDDRTLMERLILDITTRNASKLK